MTTNHDARSLRNWTPTRFFRGDDGKPVVEWRFLGDLRLTAPFFEQSVQTACARNVPVRHTSAGRLAELAERAPELPLAGLVMHLSRCGSTLVAQMLAALPAHVVVSEAETVDGLLRMDRWSPPGTEEQRVNFLRGLVYAYGARRFPEERKLFLKLDPWHILDLELIRKAFPEVPVVYLYRDPVEILMSQSDNLARTMVSGFNGPERIGLTQEETAGMTVEEYCARVLGVLAHAAVEAAHRDPKFVLVNYPQLPAAVETVIAPAFGWSPSLKEIAKMRQGARYHSKATQKVVFEADTARKQRDADGEVRELAERWVWQPFDALEARRIADSKAR